MLLYFIMVSKAARAISMARYVTPLTPLFTALPFFDVRLFQTLLLSSRKCTVALRFWPSLCTTIVPLCVVVREPSADIIVLPDVSCTAAQKVIAIVGQ
jgi:hypothetical protein